MAALADPRYAVALSCLGAGALVTWFATVWWRYDGALSLALLAGIVPLFLTSALWSVGHVAADFAMRRRVAPRALLPITITLCAPALAFFVPWLTLGCDLDFFLRRHAFREVGHRVEALAVGTGTLQDRVSPLPSDLPRIGRERGGLAIAHRPHRVTAFFEVHRGPLGWFTAFVYSSDGSLADLGELVSTPWVATPLAERWSFVCAAD